MRRAAPSHLSSSLATGTGEHVHFLRVIAVESRGGCHVAEVQCAKDRKSFVRVRVIPVK